MQAILATKMLARASLSLRYLVRPKPDAWVIPEGTVPESTAHDAAVLRVYLLLMQWASKQPGRVRVARNLALRWFEEYPASGIDPDLCVLDPAPDNFDTNLTSLCLWKPGHFIPRFCVEVVSGQHPHKDYTEVIDRYASLGVPELLVFDPLLQGPRRLGGPVALQLWRRDATGTFERVHFSSEPVHSDMLDAWLLFEEQKLVIAEDRAGLRPWLTELEIAHADNDRERAEKERERAEKEREQAARIELERRVSELEAQMLGREPSTR